MILLYDKACRALPHYHNILEVHSNAPRVVKNLTRFNPLVAGGYPMALMFAPRIRGSNRISNKYYSDYDIYFSSEEDRNEALSYLYSTAAKDTQLISTHNTDNAVTFTFDFPEEKYTIQIVKIISGSPQEVLSSFDFKNCAIGFTPADSTIFFHKEAPFVHLEGKLDLLNLWMTKQTEKIDYSYTSDIILQILRFKKYCNRWDYQLSPRSFDILMEVYNKCPNLTIKNENISHRIFTPYMGASASYSTRKNAWQSIQRIITSNPKWSPSLDRFGYLT